MTKFRFPEVVAMEIVTDSFFFFNDRYLSYRLDLLAMCAPKAQVHFMFRTYFPENYRFSDIIKQCFRQGPVHVIVFVWDTNFTVFIYNSRTRSRI